MASTNASNCFPLGGPSGSPVIGLLLSIDKKLGTLPFAAIPYVFGFTPSCIALSTPCANPKAHVLY